MLALNGTMSKSILPTGLNDQITIIKAFNYKRFWKRHGMGYIFLAPFAILFFVFTVLPVFTAMGLGFFHYNIIETPRWAGLHNFMVLLTDDDVFLIALRNTLMFAVVIGPIGYIASFVFAWIIDQLKFKKGFALAFYAPSLTSGIAMSVVWLYFFSSDRYGFINDLLFQLGAIRDPILWNRDPRYIMIVVIIISVWMSMGTGFLVFMAGLQGIPRELYEAASIDGIRSRWQELFYLVLPSIKPQLLFGAVTAIVSSFGVFDIAVQVAGMPSPMYSAHTIIAHLFDHAFIRFSLGYSSAIAMFLFIMTFTLGRIAMRIFSSKDE